MLQPMVSNRWSQVTIYSNLPRWGCLMRKVAPKHPSDVEHRAAPADQACVVRTVTDNVAFRTQHRVLQSDRVETSASFRGIRMRTVHHRTSEDFLDYI